jgi:predicted lipoprotein with Yx(FWY)xxD motif
MRVRRITVAAAGGVSLALALTACNGGGGAYGGGTKANAAPTDNGGYGASPSQDPSTPTDAPSDGQSAPAPAGNWTKVAVADNATLGKVVVDGKGWVLYRFNGDTASPAASHCAGACAKLWPPEKWTGKVKGTGFAGAGAVWGKIKRADGTWQLTLNGWPLYRYAKDAQPGDTNGEGVGGKWYASTPQGKKAMAGSGSGTGSGGSGSSGSGTGYGW